MELTYLDGGKGKSSEYSDITEVTFIELLPAERVVQRVVFESDDPSFAGTMTMTWSLGETNGGTSVEIRADDVPPGISPEDQEGDLQTIAVLAREVWDVLLAGRAELEVFKLEAAVLVGDVDHAMAVLAGDHPATRGSDLLSADASGVPGLSIVAAQRPGLALTTMRFTVRSEHDLLEHAEVFGLQTVSRADRGHFSRISPVPLSVDQAVQSTVATFSATGFEAAAVTAVGLRLVSMPVHNQRGLQMTYDRPFGFLAVHRGTGLVLFAGWVDEAQAAGRT
jgi:hypothetical protein